MEPEGAKSLGRCWAPGLVSKSDPAWHGLNRTSPASPWLQAMAVTSCSYQHECVVVVTPWCLLK